MKNENFMILGKIVCISILLLISTVIKAQNCLGNFTLNSPLSTDIHSTSMDLTWGASTNSDGNAVSFTVYYKTLIESTFSTQNVGSGTFGTLSGLLAGLTYNIKIEATGICNNGGLGPTKYTLFSNSITVITRPAVPLVNNPSLITENSFRSNWETVFSASSYKVDVAIDANFISLVVDGAEATTNYYDVSALVAGVSYYYRVRAINITGASDYSATKSLITLASVPTALAATTVSATQFTANWTVSRGADNYRMDVATNDTFSKILIGYNNLTVTGTSSPVTGLEAGNTYYYRLRAVNGSGTSASSNTITVILLPAAPLVNNPSLITENSFRANWQTVFNATSYKVDVATDVNFTSLVVDGSEINTNFYDVSALVAGTDYYYRVRAINITGASDDSAVQSIRTKPPVPITLPAPALSVSTTGFTASWVASTGADDYRLDVATDDGFLNILNDHNNLTVTGISFPVTGLEAGNTYYYRLRAVNGSGTSASSNTITVILLPAAPLVNNPSLITENSFRANWETVFNATSYKVDVATDANFTTLVVDGTEITTNFYDVSVLVTGTDYYYRVRAINITGASDDSAIQSIKTKPLVPTALPAPALSVSTTGFTASWIASTGAEDYRLDVATDDGFLNTLTGYNNLTVTGTSSPITGLEAGNIYYYRLRAANNGGTTITASSNIITIKTLPAAPVAIAAQDHSAISFNANWNPVNGASMYLLDVSTDISFNSILVGYDNLVVNSTTQLVEGLNSGNIYYYRIKAENSSGLSGHSNIIQTITKPEAPLLQDPISINQTQIEASWNNVTGADKYFLYVATDNNFSQLLEGYNGFETTNNIELINNLDMGTSYFYKVQSSNSSGLSGFSSVMVTPTIPKTPAISGFSDVTSTKFKVTWTFETGADSYEIYVAEDAGFTTQVVGYDPRSSLASLSEIFVEGLLPDKIYYLKITASNTSGSSPFSIIRTTSTANADGIVIVPEFVALEANQTNIDFSTNNGVGGIKNVTLRHRTKCTLDYTIEELSPNVNNQYNVVIDPAWIDEFGMDYEIEIQDLAERFSISSGSIRKDYVDITLPMTSFGKDINNYSIITVPFEIPNSRIEDVFVSLLGTYDKTKWRLLQFKGDKHIDFQDGLSVNNLKQGEAYWFISAEEINFNIGGGIAPDNSVDKLFEFNLVKGWNQIGNPYPVAIQWNKVLEANGNPSTISQSVTIFNKEDASFAESNTLEVMQGGFVYADEAMKIVVPVQGVTNGGRINGKITKIENNGWYLPIAATVGHVTNRLIGVGMNDDASDTKDIYDKILPPRFIDFVELKSINNHNEIDLSADVVSSSPSHTWTYSIAHNINDQAIKLQWDNEMVRSLNEELFLYDPTSNDLINMGEINNYVFNSQQYFQIIYGRQNIPQISSNAEFGSPFPNPSEGNVTIPVYILNNEACQLWLNINSITGRSIYSSSMKIEQEGLAELLWDGTSNNGSIVQQGMYIYTLIITNGQDNKQYKGVIIRK